MKMYIFYFYRTQDQLGYIVFSGVRRANGAKGLRIIVQSAKPLDYVDERIEKFLESMIVSIKKINMKKILTYFNFSRKWRK